MRFRTILLLAIFINLLFFPFQQVVTYARQSGKNPPEQEFTCGINTVLNEVMDNTTVDQWAGWVRKLSGEEIVSVGGQKTRLTTRYSPAMFERRSNALAFDYVLEQVRGWVDESQIEVDPYPMEWEGKYATWKNLIVTLPGTSKTNEVVVMSAHLDTISDDPYQLAPGAEDNASGSATLLEAVRLLHDLRFERTIRIIWFTGEEEGLFGSEAYAADHNVQNIIGVINLDMFGYDSNNDRCMELHVGTLPASDRIGRCFQSTAWSYGILLNYDYLKEDAFYGASDYGPFWDRDIGAIEVLENYADQQKPGGCKGVDQNPHYHTPSDTVKYMNLPLGFDIARTGLGTLVNMAVPLDAQTQEVPPLAQLWFLVQWILQSILSNF